MSFFTRLIVVAFLFLLTRFTAVAQVTGGFRVMGDSTKFYPVVFIDGGWNSNVATELELGRSDVHADNRWSGSLIAKFRYHVTNYGNGSNFIDADVRQAIPGAGYNKFVASWRDGSFNNYNRSIVIWLRGGNTVYNYKSNYAVTPTIYDGVQLPLPYQETGGPAQSFKTAVDTVNSLGATYSAAAYFNSGSNHYIAGNLGLGTLNPGSYKLAVEGTIGARKVKVTQGSWADFVFHPDYKLPALSEVECFIKENKHLPEIPSAKDVERDGLDVGDMNRKLLQKIEELTLYIIELKKENERQWEAMEKLKK